MADSAFQIQYRQEFIAQFEQGQSWLRTVCTTEAVIKGKNVAIKNEDSGWQAASEMEKEEGRASFLARRMQSFKAPAGPYPFTCSRRES